jgi:predicted dinucleotide-binding enzyme
MNKIAIIGAGAIGTAIARLLSKAGIAASIANSRGPESLAALSQELGVTPVSVAEAAKADIVFLAVNWARLPEAVRGLGPWDGRIVIDANNAVEVPSFRAVDLDGRASSSVVADLLPGARVVKAFNHLGAALLGSDPQSDGGRRVLFYSGDEQDAKARVAELIGQLGFAGIDLGTLDGGGRLAQFPGGPLPVLNLVRMG